MERSPIAQLTGGINRRLVLGAFSVHLLLVPALFGGLLYMVENGYQEQFVNDARSNAYLLQNLVKNEMAAGRGVERLVDEASVMGKIIYAQISDAQQRNMFIHDELEPSTHFKEDFFFNQHGDDIYFIALNIEHQNQNYTLRLGFDETITKNKIFTAYIHGIYLAAGYIILTFGLLVMVIPKLNRMRREIVRQADVLEYQSMHDGLTGLPNRNLFENRVNQVARLRSDRQYFALLLMDLNRFKQVNDTLGHCTGDAVLIETGIRLREVVRTTDTTVRLGGDEFAILLPNSDLEGAEAVAKKLIEIMDRPFLLEHHSLHIGASIGIALAPKHGMDVNTLMRHVDVAMYEAKRTNCGYKIYEESLDRDSLTRLALTSDLKEGLGRGEFQIVFQPQLDLRSGEITSAEALMRWNHPTHGVMLPENFIKLAEDSGLITNLTSWILRETLRQISQWNRKGTYVKIAVNLSPVNLHDPELPEKIDKLLKEYEVHTNQLELEITESAIFSDIDRAIENLQKIHNMGITLSIDDFGTGYSSLAHLKNLPISQIKIDRSFIKDLQKDVNSTSIVLTLVDLAHVLNLQVVAEGAEDMETLETLKKLACDKVQGFYISPPMPAHELENYLVSQSVNYSHLMSIQPIDRARNIN